VSTALNGGIFFENFDSLQGLLRLRQNFKKKITPFNTLAPLAKTPTAGFRFKFPLPGKFKNVNQSRSFKNKI
jgi:hypothetical protein